MRTNGISAVAVFLTMAACAFGQNASEWPVATRAGGATARIVSSSGIESTAELLEVRDDGYVLQRPDGILVVAPYSTVTRLDIPGLGRPYDSSRGLPPSREARAKLISISHFPQGMTDAMRAQLMKKTGQTELLVLK